VPHNKKQHYVPRFYLKNFAADQDQKTIHLYNMNRRLFRHNVGIKGQCHHDYFYGEDQILETVLQDIESKAAIIIKTALRDHLCPDYNSPNHMDFIYYIALQRARTKTAELEANALTDASAKFFFEEIHPEFGSLDGIKISLKNAVQLAVSSAGMYAPILWDMEIKLITIADESEFFVSDNPTVFFNQIFPVL
jgi:Protein of unknown function (DUF4238)